MAEIDVEVIYALAEKQVLVRLRLPAGATVEEAVRRSGLLEKFAEIDPAGGKVGVFGRLAPLDRVLEAGDRVEIYRPLLADPKEVRRRLAAEGRTMGRKGRETEE